MGYLAADPAAVTSLPRAALRTWRAGKCGQAAPPSCASSHKHLHSFPAPERTCAFCRERGAQAGRPGGESDHLHGRVHSAGASPLPRPAHAAPLPPSLPAPWASSWQVLLPWPPRLLAPPQGHPLTETFLLRACDPWGPRDKVPQTGLNSAGVRGQGVGGAGSSGAAGTTPQVSAASRGSRPS